MMGKKNNGRITANKRARNIVPNSTTGLIFYDYFITKLQIS